MSAVFGEADALHDTAPRALFVEKSLMLAWARTGRADIANSATVTPVKQFSGVPGGVVAQSSN